MKTTNKFLVLALMAVATVFASCSKDDDDSVGPTQQEIETKMLGKWKYVSENGVPVLTNDRSVTTYHRDKTATISVLRFIGDLGIYVWDNKTTYTWNVEGNIVCEKLISAGITTFKQVVNVDDNQYSCIYKKIIDSQGVEHIRNSNQVSQKVTADYSQDILGMWEGTAMTGYETYGDYHHRIEYRADGTYTYYSWDEAAQAWKPLEDVFDEWNVDGDWLATRWQNKGSDVMNYEWWDIDYIKDSIMKWSALREKEDGERFTTTFTWKKVK